MSRPVFKCPLLAAGVLGTVFDILSQEVDMRLKVRSSVHYNFQLTNVKLSAEPTNYKELIDKPNKHACFVLRLFQEMWQNVHWLVVSIS